MILLRASCELGARAWPSCNGELIYQFDLLRDIPSLAFDTVRTLYVLGDYRQYSGSALLTHRLSVDAHVLFHTHIGSPY